MALSRIQAAASGTVMFWGTKIAPKEPYVRTLPYILTISLASLDPSSIPASDNEPVVLKAVVGKRVDDDSEEEDEKEKTPETLEIILCTLRPHSTNQVSIDFVLETHTEVQLKVEGKHDLCVTGYFTIEEDEDDDMLARMYGGSDEDDDEDDDGADEEDDDDEDEISKMVKQAPQGKKATKQQQQQQQQQQQKQQQKQKQPEQKKTAEEEGKKRKREAEPTEEEGKKKQKAAPSPTPAPAQTSAPTNQKVKKFPNGLVIEDLKEGGKNQAAKGSAVTIDYKGQLSNGKIFDTGKKLKFKVGRGEVIQGMEQGVLGMKVGGSRKITIPASLGYGSQKIPGIPPNSTLVFTIDLVNSV